jgi:2-polyprenyl-3-methyl-5-hydroxy-6-metoxy-1,4-benzoquinol methylase
MEQPCSQSNGGALPYPLHQILGEMLEVLRHEPVSAAGLVKIGESFFHNDLTAPANGFFQAALERDPHCTDAMNDMGVMAFASGEYEKAESLFMDALETAPDFSEARQNLAKLYSEAPNLADQPLEDHVSTPCCVKPISDNAVSSFYDLNVKEEIKDFINGNERNERAWETILRWAPDSVNSILEIGCGIGYISWRMSQVFNSAECNGIDTSQRSLDIARKLFAHPSLKYISGPLTEELTKKEYDLIVLMDVYEHIAQSDRPSLHAAIKKLCHGNTRIILTFPTPGFLNYLRLNRPDQIQPIGENIDQSTLDLMALETGTKLIHYGEINVWSENDYAHVVFAVNDQICDDRYKIENEKLHLMSKAERLRFISEKLGVDVVKPVICYNQPADINQFIGQKLTTGTIDNYFIRNKILLELIKFLPSVNGAILDVGCGEMPYKPLIVNFNDRISSYIGLDIENPQYQSDKKPDLFWDGNRIPLENSSVDCAMATELFEHLPDLETVLLEIMRVLKPGGKLFFTVPFLWPLHDAPQDEYRYTPFSLKRIIEQAGFTDTDIKALGGWDASLAQMMGLWLKRSPMEDGMRQEFIEQLFPFYKNLLTSEQGRVPLTFDAMSKQNIMITGLHGTAVKPDSPVL